jgi:caspase domain-containing protein/TIR domain-containing protein
MYALTNAQAVIIGIANYLQINRLPPTVLADAQDIYNLLVDPKHCGYPKENVRLLLDSEATQAAIRQTLVDLAAHGDPDATVFFYISSHGGQIESGPSAGEYLLPVDTVYTSADSLVQTALSGAEFTEALRRIPARKMVVVFDCCHSGGIGQPKDVAASELKSFPESYYETLKTGRGRVILAASRSNEYSWILPSASNSLFTQHLLAGLRGGAPGPGGVIRIFDLFNYVQPRVVADRSDQHPLFKAELEENFPVGLYLGGKAPALPTPMAASDDSVYDVFVSYRQQEPDKSWVRKTLLPKLEAEGVKTCIDYRDFRLGAALIKEMQRAVLQSRYSLAVLTSAYLQSNFTDFENVLAQHLGLEKGQRRLLAIMREECAPELRLRAQLWLDMTNDDEFEMNVQRLVYELRQSPGK